MILEINNKRSSYVSYGMKIVLNEESVEDAFQSALMFMHKYASDKPENYFRAIYRNELLKILKQGDKDAELQQIMQQMHADFYAPSLPFLNNLPSGANRLLDAAELAPDASLDTLAAVCGLKRVTAQKYIVGIRKQLRKAL